MADADDAPPTPPPEVVAPEDNPAASDSAVAAPAQVDNKRKLEEASAEAEANGTGTGEDTKRLRVDGEPDAATVVEQQNDGSSVNVEEPAAGEEEDTAAPGPVSQAVSDEKPLEAAAEAPRQEGGDAATDAQAISRIIQVPSSKVRVLVGKAGETIMNLQKSSGARIHISTKFSDVDSNALTWSVKLVGTLGSVDKAEQLIKSVIAEAEARGSHAGFGSGQTESEQQFEMEVPPNKAGLIIGKNGVTIRDLQLESGARIELIHHHPIEGVTNILRVTGVRVSGSKKQIGKGFDQSSYESGTQKKLKLKHVWRVSSPHGA